MMHFRNGKKTRYPLGQPGEIVLGITGGSGELR
jgi:hypothetical protein